MRALSVFLSALGVSLLILFTTAFVADTFGNLPNPNEVSVDVQTHICRAPAP